jgi:DNA-binding MarR family transcriptional regulator
MAEMADLMKMDRTTLVRALKPLREKGWIDAVPEGSGSRRHALTLMAAGHAKIVEAIPLWQAAQSEYEAEVGTDRAYQLRSDFLTTTGAVEALRK